MSERPQLIGLTGRAGVGKDTLAAYLATEYGYQVRAFADPLRAILNARFGWSPDLWANREWKESAAWHNEAGPFSPRNWAQWLGTDVLREYAGFDIFVRLAFRDWDLQPFTMVVPDVRFDNEAQAIIDRGGLVLKLTRNDAAPVHPHVSERGVAPGLIHGAVCNDGVREQLYDSANLIMRQLWRDRMPVEQLTWHDVFDHVPRDQS